MTLRLFDFSTFRLFLGVLGVLAVPAFASEHVVAPLADSLDLGLRWALAVAAADPGPSTVRFPAGGTIVLASDITVTDRDLTIEGNGATIEGHGLLVYRSERVRIEQLRIRRTTSDCLRVANSTDVALDRLTLSDGGDECLDITDSDADHRTQRVLVLRCLITGGASGGCLVGPNALPPADVPLLVAFERCVFADSPARMPRVQGGRVRVVNCVQLGVIGGVSVASPARVDLIANLAVARNPMPAGWNGTNRPVVMASQGAVLGGLYLSGNVSMGFGRALQSYRADGLASDDYQRQLVRVNDAAIEPDPAWFASAAQVSAAAIWSACLSGPGVESCPSADADSDGDVDLSDLSISNVRLPAVPPALSVFGAVISDAGSRPRDPADQAVLDRTLRPAAPAGGPAAP